MGNGNCDTCWRSFDPVEDVCMCPNDRSACVDCCICSLHAPEATPIDDVVQWLGDLIDDQISVSRQDPYVSDDDYLGVLRIGRDARRYILQHS